ncbi:autotransporter-associated beta strand repeat-containing protein [Azospirillum doebereinerae]|uniref:autotransporter-associated beta strand repeat-containing protein n=1 Tax=Azospirillum doebereinerae TaxID=92933 RepID=UPI00384B4398
MFDAAGAATADPAATDHASDHAIDPAAADHTADQSQHDALAAAAASAASVGTPPATAAAPVEIRAAEPALNDGKREVVFIESNVADRQILMNGVAAGVEVVLLDSGQDGLSQMAQWAQTHTGYDAVHVISHGGEGRIYLGALTLDTATAEARGADLAALGSALTENGDLLLYGCDVATNAGQGFVAAVAAATRADVAASTNETGAARLGGDWVLESAFGSIETAALYGAGEADGYDHVLGTTQVGTEAALNTAIANAADGDIIELTADITLTGALNTATKSITIQGNYHKIDGANGYTGFFAENAPAGSSMSITLTVEKVEFVNTSAAVGVADNQNTDGYSISAIVRDCIIHNAIDDFSGYGTVSAMDNGRGKGAVSLTVERSVFYDNAIYSVYIKTNDSPTNSSNTVSSTIRDSLIYNNAAGTSAVYIDSQETTGGSSYLTVNLINDTIVKNDTGVTVNKAGSVAPTVNVKNSIVIGNTTDTVGTITATTNSITTGAITAVNFVDAGANDYRLASTASNALNQGNSSDATGSTDVRGMDRIRQGTVDIGAYESPYTNAGVAGIGPASDLNGAGGGTNNTVTVANGAATNVPLFDGAATVTQPDSELNLTRITVALTGVADSGSEKLALTAAQIAAARLNNITVTGNDSATLTLSGGASLANYQTVLRQILYSNVAGTPTAGNRTVTVTPTDDIAGASPSTTTLTIRAANTAAPALDASKSPAFTTQALSTSTAVPTGAVGTLVSALVNTTGVANFSDGDGDSPGMAITATDTTSGSWYYTTDGGTTWTAVGTVSNTSALLLAADANTRLFFKANIGYSGTLSSAVTFRAWDQSTGTAGSKVTTATNGAATAFSTATDTASLTVTDDVAPTVSGVTSSTTDGTYGIGGTVSIQVNFSEAVTVTGTPQLTLETGTTDRTINYAGGSGTGTLTFTYTVQAGDTSADLDYQSISALTLNGGTIKDAAGNDATLTLPATGSGSSLGGAKNIVINTAPTITSATYDASTNTLAVTGANITDGATIDVTKFTLTGEGGSTYTLTSDSSVTSTPGSNSFTITLGATDQAYVEGLLNKNSTSSQDSTAYNLAAAANWNSTQSAASDLTSNGITVSNTQKPAISSVTYDATTGVLTVTGTNLVHQAGAGNDIDLSKLTIAGQGGTVTLSGAVEITSATSFTVTLTGADKTGLNAKLDKNGGTSTGGTAYKITSADNWNGTIYGDISDSTGVGITVSGNNSAPAISDLNTDSVAWAGVGGTVTLDAGTAVTVSDAENGTNNWSGASLTVQRSATSGTASNAWLADVFGFGGGYTVDTTAHTISDGGTQFATYTNTGGVLTVTFDGNATAARIGALMSGISYRNDTPAGDATIRFTLNDGHGATTTADVTVTTNVIHVTVDGDGGTIDATDGVDLREAVAIANGQTGTQTIVFGGGLVGHSITLGSDLAIGENITVDADAASGLTITGSTITVASGTTLTLTNGSGDTLSIASKITGSGAVAKTGVGTLTLSGGNDYSGATSIGAGTLTVNGGIGDSSAVTVASGATLALSGAETIGSLTGAGAVTLGSSTLTAGGDDTSTTFDGIVSGTGGLSKAGNGTLTLTGANSYTGTTTVGAGTLELNSSAGTALADSGAVTLSGGTLKLSSANETIGTLSGASGTLALGANALTIAQASNQTFSGAITGTSSGSLTLNAAVNSTSLTLDGTTNSTGFLGGITVTKGWLQVSADSNLGAGTLTLNGGTLRLTGTAGTIDNAIAVGSGGGTVSVAPSGSATLSGVLSGSGALVKAAPGDLTLSGNNSSFSGAFTINSGTVTVSNANALGDTTGGTTVADGAALALSGGITIAENLTLSGSGVSSGGALVSASGTNTVSGTVTLNADATVTATSALTLSGVVSGGNALTKAGSGTLTLSGNNGYTGATTVSAGTLVAAHANALGTTAAGTTVSSGAAVEIANGITLAEAFSIAGTGVSSTGALTVASGSTVTLSGTVTLTADASIGGAGTLTVSGVVSGGNALTKVGSGTLTLSGNNGYTGATTVSAGTLVAAHANALGTTAAGTTVSSGAAVEIANGITLAEAFSIAGTGVSSTGALTVASGSTVTLSGTVTLTADASIGGAGTLTVSGVVSGGNALTKVGSGTLTLSGNNGYTGATTVSAGTLVAAHNNALGTTAGGTTVSTGATLALANGVTLAEALTIGGVGVSSAGALQVTSGSATVSGAITMSSATTIGVSGTGLTLSNAIGGAFNLTTDGTGTLTLSGTNTYTGTTTVGAGTLIVTGTLNDAAAGAVTVGNGGTLAGTGTVNGGLTVQSGGTLSPGIAGTNNGVGTLTVNGGLTIQSGGTLAVDLVSTGSHDQVAVTGAVDVSSATLTTGGSYAPVKTVSGDSFAIVTNDGSDAVTGSFNGLTSGASITLNGGSITVSYAAGTGSNDIVLSGPVNQAPALGGTFTTAGTVNDNATTTPFSGVTVADADDTTGSFTVIITYTAANGTLSSGTPSALTGSAGNYTLTATTPGGLQTLLQGLVFTPTANQVVPGSTVATSFTLTASDGTTSSSANSSTAVTATSINDAPADILLSNSSVSVYDGSSATVGTLSATDADTGQTLTYTLVSGGGDTNNGLFTVSGTSLVANDASTLTAGQSYSVRVQVSDGTATYEKSFTISVNNDLVVDVLAVDSSAPAGTYSADKADGGGLDLREAITLANAFLNANPSSSVTIRFAGTLTGTITLPSSLTVRSGVALAMDSTSDNLSLTIQGISSSLTMNGTLNVSVATGDTLTIDNTLTGSGAALTKSGSGTLVLGGNNSYTGATTVSGGGLTINGSLDVNNAVTVGTGATLTVGASALEIGSLAGAGTVAINSGKELTVGSSNAPTSFSGNFSGAGGLTKMGSGTMTLSGTSSGSFSGTMAVREGTLSVAGDANLGSGAVTLNGGTLTVTGAGTIDNTITLGVNDGFIDTSVAVTLSNVISGSGGLTKSGSGTLTLSGASTYSGITTVSAGTLLVTGALNGTSGVSVASGATLGGTGSIFSSGSNQVTINSGATLAPGVAGTNNGIGTLTINGNLRLSGTLAAEIGGGGGVGGTDYDQVVVNGTVSLNGGPLTVSRINGYTSTNGATYRIIDNDGSDAIAGASGTFGTIAEGTDTTSNGDIYTVSYLGGTGNDAVLTAVVNPTVSSVSATTANGSYKAGDTVSITVTFNRAVTVTGTPTLALGTGRTATYSSGSGGTTLTFTYTVQAGDTSADLDYASTSALALNGGTIADSSSSLAALLTLAAPGAANSLGANKAIVIDTTAPGAPTAPDMTAGTDSGSSSTDNVTSNTTPTFTGTAEPNSTVTLYDTDGTTVLGTGTTDGSGNYSVTPTTALTPGTHTLTVKARDAAGNVSSVSGGLSVIIDTSAPAAPGTPVLPAASDTGISGSDGITRTATPTITGTAEPNSTVTLYDTDGTTVLGTGTADGSGNYSVTVATALSTGPHTITVKATDAAGNVSTASPGLTVTVDTTAPTVTSVTSPTADGSYKAGDTISIQVSLSEAVIVNGTPTITLSNGRTATYSGGSGTGTLTFTYTVQAGDTAADLDYASTTALALNGGTVTDTAGNDAATTLPAVGGGSSLGGTKNIVIDTTAPTVSSVSVPTGSTYKAGDVMEFTVAFNEAVTVTGSPTLPITLDDGTVVQAAYVSGSGGTSLTFRYTVQGGLSDTDGVRLVSALSGGTITDLAGNAAVRTPGNVADTSGARIDSVAPTVTNVTSGTANGTYTTGETISIQVTFSEAVTVNGTPTLALNTGRTATYSGGSGSNTLTFTYTVQAGDTSADLDAIGTGALAGSVADAVGNAGILTLTAPGDVRSLGQNKDIVIDTTPPTIRSVVVPNDGPYGVGKTLSFFVQVSEVVLVNGTPTITLDIGGQTRQAVYNAAASTGSSLRFDYVVHAGDSDTDGIAVTGLNLNGGSITDQARMPLPTTLTGLPSTQNVLVDTVAPDTPSAPALAAGQDTGVSATDGVTGIRRPTLGGTAEAGATVTVLIDGVAVGTTIAGSDGSSRRPPRWPTAPMPSPPKRPTGPATAAAPRRR